MIRTFSFFFVVLASISINAQTSKYVEDQLIVRFLSGDSYQLVQDKNQLLITSPSLEPLLEQFQFTNAKPICKLKDQDTHTYLLNFSGGQDVKKMAEAFLATGLFSMIEPNGYVHGCVFPNDPVFPKQYGLHNTGNFGPQFSTLDSDADLPEAWDIEQGDSNVVVAVIDGGIAFAHPEFAGRTWVNYAEIPNNNIDDDNNGYIDDYLGWNFITNNGSPDDDNGHGTAVAGVIGANSNNGFGGSGVDWNCKLMICKVLNNFNSGTYADLASAIYYAFNNGADIINISITGDDHVGFIAMACQSAWLSGCTIFAATGNSNSSIPKYPAAYGYVMAVGASNAYDGRYLWSNYGTHMDVVAAGDFIYKVNWNDFNNDSTYASGTSFASPFVAGIAALLKGQKLTRTNYEIRNIIRATAEDEVDEFSNEDTTGWDIYFGYGRVNAYTALMYDSLNAINETISQKQNLIVYPNPTTGTFTVQGETATIEVLDIFGRLVLTTTNQEVDMTNHAKGIYFIKVGEVVRKLVLR